MEKRITIIIDFEIYLYLLLPIIKVLQERRIEIYIICNSSMQSLLKKKLINQNGLNFIDLKKIKKKTILLRGLHRTLAILFTDHKYSLQYGRQIKLMIKRGGINKYVSFLSFLIPKVNNINFFIDKITGIFSKDIFPTKKVIVGSLNASAELLCHKNNIIYTIMESWDHTVKTPNYYKSDFVFLWNQNFADDWIKYQKDNNVMVTYPLKLRYADEIVYKQNLFNKTRKNAKKCVYAFASTNSFSVPYLTKLEHIILEKICKATEKAGWSLMIKPRPVGNKNEFDSILKKYENVSIGFMKEGKELAANYYLDDSYNKKRFEEICDSQFVINCFTTFGLDAAVAGIPVLQLDTRGDIELNDSKLFYSNYHISNYLLNSKNILRVEQGEMLEDVLYNYLLSDGKFHQNYSKELRSWLINDNSNSLESIRSIINRIMDN